MKFIVDKEINLNVRGQDSLKDLLHTKRYADLLLQCVKDAPQEEPYTIGLFGEWGSGKSSVIKTMVDGIATDPELKNFKVVDYDAWKYSGDSFRRMFLYEMRNSLGMKESPLMQHFYVNETHETKIKTSINWKKIVLVGVFIIFSAAVICLLSSFLGENVAIPSTIALIALLFSLYSFIFDQLKVSVSKPLLFAPEQFEECYKEIVGCATKWDRYKEKTLKWISLGLHHEQYMRLVVVVDNIDRCQADKAYTLLTDVKNFLCKDFDVIFIVPVDIEALRKHILKQSTENHGVEADEFLRKFFNASVWMKPYQNDEMFDFAEKLAKQNKLYFNPNTISLIANEFATNPRRIIQLFNNLQIELQEYQIDFAQKHQTLICKLLVIREEFPSFYKILLIEPSKLFVDIEIIRQKSEEQRTDEENALLRDKRLSAFLLITYGVSSKYSQQLDVIIRILVNTQIENNLPENIRQAYHALNIEILVNYSQEAQNCNLLVNYLQDNIKKMVQRRTYDAEGKSHIGVLLALFENGLLSNDDKARLLSPIASPNTLSKCISLFADKESMIRLGVDLETLNMVLLSNVIIKYFNFKNNSEMEFSNEDIQNLYFGLSVWGIDKCKKLNDEFFKALQSEPVGYRKYDYGKEKLEVLFTKEVYNFIFVNLNVDDCIGEKSAFQTFKYLAHNEVVSKDILLQFIIKATEIAPTFDYKNSQKQEPAKYLIVLSEIFSNLRYLGKIVPLVTMTRLFDKVNAVTTEKINVGYSGSVSKTHSFVTDRAAEKQIADIIISFFINVNLITDGGVICNADIEWLMKADSNRDKILDALVYLLGQGKDISTWTNAVISDIRRTDVRRTELLKASFIKKNKDDKYVVDNAIVSNEIIKLLGVIQQDTDDAEVVVKMITDILGDERIDTIVREIISKMKLDEQKNLPLSLKKKAISSFENNIDKLIIPTDENILQLIAANGSDVGIEGVWAKVNPILADSKNQPQNVINSAIQILLSFTRLSMTQSDALAGNIKALTSSKCSDEKKKEILLFLKNKVHES